MRVLLPRSSTIIAALLTALLVATNIKSQEVPTGFDVTQHGFSFANDDWGRVCYSLSGATQLRYDANGTFCSGGWGLCGGMSLVAGERFMAGVKSILLSKAQAKESVVNAQFRTLDSETVIKFLDWIAAPDKGHWYDSSHSIGYRMKQDWNGSIKPTLSSHEPVVLGLIFDKKTRLIDLRQVGGLTDLTNQHQVLGIGFKQTGDQVEIQAYDPNYPCEVLSLTFTLGKAGVNQGLLSGNPLGAGRRTPRGVMFVRRPTVQQAGGIPPGGTGGASTDGALLREENGTIWVIYGGVKFHVPDLPTLNRLFANVPLQQLCHGALITIGSAPTDSTLLREENGAIWAVYGGAKFHVPDPPTFDRLFTNVPMHQLWDGALNAVGSVPTDGTLLREENGAIWVIYGGAKFHVPDAPTFDRLFINVPLHQLWDGALNAIGSAPADGTLLREENGAIWVIYGGAKFHVPDPATLGRLFANAPIDQLWDGALNAIPLIPVDGTLFREESSTQVYIIFEGKKKAVTSPTTGPVHVLWVGALAQIPS